MQITAEIRERPDIEQLARVFIAVAQKAALERQNTHERVEKAA
jgi:hypothetical protein